ASGWLLLLLCGVIRFQPWDWDNTKLLVYAVLFLSIFISVFLADLMQKGAAGLVLSGFLLLVVTFSSFDQWYQALRPGTQGYVLWTGEDVELAQNFRIYSKPDALILISNTHNNAVANLSGRQVLMGYDGWLWSYGLDYFDRKSTVDRFYSCEAGVDLLTQWGIDYVVFDRGSECDLPGLQLYLANAAYKIYRVIED
ncbi:hypothetical protein KJ605_01870, partial [Patescibacteria group bacterium]|nr:hypothetical protein [Patescibacteria group bacterium]